jgi:hypothetical protein
MSPEKPYDVPEYTHEDRTEKRACDAFVEPHLAGAALLEFQSSTHRGSF